MFVRTKPIPVRVPTDWIPRLDAVAEKLGTRRATLIAFCVKSFVEVLERDGEIKVPPNWHEILAALDGRKNRRGRPILLVDKYPGHSPSAYSLNDAPRLSVAKKGRPRNV
jgi:hypothetical protein